LALFAGIVSRVPLTAQTCAENFAPEIMGSSQLAREFQWAVFRIGQDGTAYLIDRDGGYLLTARHIVIGLGKSKPIVMSHAGKPIAFHFAPLDSKNDDEWLSDERTDLALLQVDNVNDLENITLDNGALAHKAVALNVGLYIPELLEVLVNLGYPKIGNTPIQFNAFEPRVSSRDGGVIQTNQPAFQGSSGSPLIDKTGSAVGTFKTELADHTLAQYVPMSKGIELLEKVDLTGAIRQLKSDWLENRLNLAAFVPLLKDPSRTPSNLQLYLLARRVKTDPTMQQVPDLMRCLAHVLKDRGVPDVTVWFHSIAQPADVGPAALAVAEREALYGNLNTARNAANMSATAFANANDVTEADARYLLGRIEFDLDDKAAAKDDFDRYLILTPEGSHASEVRTYLERITTQPDPGELRPPQRGGDFGTFDIVVNRSGSNQLHGSGYYYHEDGALNSRNFFAPEKPKWLSHVFGSTLGGPIMRNRTFFFVGYDGLRNTTAVSSAVTVPSANSLASARAVLAAKRITENGLSTSLLNLFPSPNRTANFNNLLLNTPTVTNWDQVNARIDQKLDDSDKANHQLAFRFLTFGGNNTAPSGGSPLAQYRSVTNDRRREVSVQMSNQLSPNQANEFDFIYTRRRSVLTSVDAGFNPTSIGLNTGVTDSRLFGLPLITITGAVPLGADPATPNGERNQNLTFRDVHEYRSRSLMLKFGGDFMHVNTSSFSDFVARGRLSFDGSILGNPLADFLAGFPSGNTSILRGDTHREFIQNSLSGYAQAHRDFGKRRRIGIEAGVRYDFAGVIREKDNLLSNFIPESSRLLSVGSTVLAKLYANDWDNLGPSVGVAIDAIKDNKDTGRLIVHAGWHRQYVAPSIPEISFAGGLPNSGIPGPATNPVGRLPVLVVRPETPVPFGRGVAIFGQATSRGPFDVFAVDPHLESSEMNTFTTSADVLPSQKLILTVAYIGEVGEKLRRVLDLNQPAPGDRLTQDNRRPFFSASPQFRAINLLIGNASSRYNALQITAEGRSASLGKMGSVAFNAILTVSSNTDDISFPQDNRNLSAERGRALLDQHQRFALSFQYDLPAKWSISGVWLLSSGLPSNPIISFDNGGTAGFVDRPNLVGDPNVPSQSPGRFVNPAAFQIPAPGTIGSAGKNILDGPGFNNVDLRLQKQIAAIGGQEKVKFQLSGECFDLFNHPNFRRVYAVVDDPRFGTLTSTDSKAGNRTVQVGLKLWF
jgi:hypothetical protein